MPQSNVYISLGSNLGDRLEYLRLARRMIGDNPKIKIICCSKVYESEPWGMESKSPEVSWFLNQCFKIETSLPPEDLLVSLQKIEKRLGRKRSRLRYSSRPIDLDILLYGDKTIKLPNLIIPHPRMHLRKFVLVPLLEITPDLAHPVTLEPFRNSLKSISKKDNKKIKIYHEPPKN